MSLHCVHMSCYTRNGVSTNWNFWEGCSQVTRYSSPLPDIIKSYSQKSPKFELDHILDQKSVLKSFSRHHQKLFPKNPKFEQDDILDPKHFLVFWFIQTNIACKWCSLFLRTFGHLHFWEGFQGLEFGGTLSGEYQNGKRDQNLRFSYATWMNFSKKYIPAVVLGNLLVGKAFKGKA